MARPVVISTMIILPLASGLIGLQLGRSAVAEINTAYLRAEEVRFHSDLVANPPNFEADVPASLADAAVVQGLGSGCIKCIDYPEEYRPVRDPSFDTVAAWSETPAVAEEPAISVETAAAEPEAPPSPVARYVHYVITEDGEQTRATEMPAERVVASEPVAGPETVDIDKE